MKKTLIAVTASVFFAVACGDDSSSNASSETPASPEKVQTKTGRYQIDESQNLLILLPDTTYTCVISEEKVAWDPSPRRSADTAKYEFQGDSLILHAFRGGSKSSLEEIYIGGKPGKFDGTWSRSCLTYYIGDEPEEPDCYDPPQFSFTFSDGKLTQTTILDSVPELDENPDFMNSALMSELYHSIYTGAVIFDANKLFSINPSRVQSAIQSNEVNIKKSDKTSQVFEINGKTFSININKATETPYYNGYIIQTTKSVQMELSNGTTTCKLDFSEKLVDKDLCNAENSKHLVVEKDILNSEIKTATIYREGNEIDFEDCFATLL